MLIPRILRAVVLFSLILSTRASRARAAEEEKIVPGGNIVTTVRAPVKVGDEVLMVLDEGTVLVAGRLDGDWIRVTVAENKKKIEGWVYAKHVTAKKPDEKDAMMYLVVGRLDQSIAEWNELNRREPDAPLPYFFRGLCYRVQGDYGKAVADCSELLLRAAKEIEAKPDTLNDTARDFLATVYNLRGAARMRKDDLAGALADFDEAVRVDSRQKIPRWNRFLVHLMQGEVQKADADKREGLAPPDKKTLDSSRELFEILTGNRPKLVEPHVACGFCYWMGGKLDKAIAEYSEAIRLDPKQADVYFRRALVYHAKGENNKAEADLKKARQLAPHLAKAVLSTPNEPTGRDEK